MALNRRSGQRFQASIWPGFVDAMTALLLVLFFVLTIFMVVQSIQTETITGQESRLDRLSAEVNTLARALGAEQQRSAGLADRVDDLGRDLDAARDNADIQTRLISSLRAQVAERDAALETADARLDEFEERVALLLSQRDTARADAAQLGDEVDRLQASRDALDTALAAARDEIDAQAEAARLAAARREALEALAADLRAEAAAQDAALTATRDRLAEVEGGLAEAEAALTEEEAARLAESEAARRLRARLEAADAELTAMTLALEEKRREAEETLTLLAAAQSARDDLDARLMAALIEGEQTEAALETARAALADARGRLEAEGATADDLRQRLADALAARETAEAEAEAAMSRAERQARLLATAERELAGREEASTDDRRRLALLNEQVADLRGQLQRLQGLLATAEAEEADAQVQIEALGQRLNTALARVAEEERARAELEAERARRLEREAADLETYRSEFFGRLRRILGDREGIRIDGDRFVFSSEVLFASGSADLSPSGRQSIANLAETLQEVAAIIPAEIDWIIRVDGHTDDVPVSAGGVFDDNWELSQARALSVVRYMIDSYGFPPERLAATGFGEFQPVDPGDSAAARARNRRIELKLTER